MSAVAIYSDLQGRTEELKALLAQARALEDEAFVRLSRLQQRILNERSKAARTALTAPEGTAPKGTVPEGTATEGTAPEDTAPKGTAPQCTAPEGTVPEGTAPKGTAPEGTVPEGTAPKGTAPEGTAPKGTAPEGTAPKGTAPEGTAPKGTAPEGTVPGPTNELNVGLEQLQAEYDDVEVQWKLRTLYVTELRAEWNELQQERDGEEHPYPRNCLDLNHSKPIPRTAKEVSPSRAPMIREAYPEVDPQLDRNVVETPISQEATRRLFDTLDPNRVGFLPRSVVEQYFAQKGIPCTEDFVRRTLTATKAPSHSPPKVKPKANTAGVASNAVSSTEAGGVSQPPAAELVAVPAQMVTYEQFAVLMSKWAAM